jgi:hypothetical protein
MKSTVAWDWTLCSLVDVYRHFVRTYCLRLQGQSVRPVSKETDIEYSSLFGLIFNTEDGDSKVLRNVRKLLLDYTASLPRRQYQLITESVDRGRREKCIIFLCLNLVQFPLTIIILSTLHVRKCDRTDQPARHNNLGD